MTAPLQPADGRPAAGGAVAERASAFRIGLNLAGVAIVGWSILGPGADRPSPLAIGTTVVALAAWSVSVLLPAGRTQDALLVVTVLAGSLGVGGTHGILVAAVAAAIIPFASRPERPLTASGTLAAGSAVLIAASAVLSRQPVEFLLAVASGLVVAVLVGVTRRQNRIAERRERELLSRSLEAEREAARTRLLEDRAAAARDIHDVLAHSLGGLVIQLDAVDALLEAGRTAEAATRVEQARRLAADGLAEARRAVTALRDPGAAADEGPVGPTIEDLLDTHRALGGRVTVEGDVSLSGLDGSHREAVVRVVQEALSNARRHSPGTETRLTATREADGLRLTVATPIPATAGSSGGGGHGLIGMRERFAALDDGSAVTAGRAGDRFVIDARVVLP